MTAENNQNGGGGLGPPPSAPLRRFDRLVRGLSVAGGLSGAAGVVVMILVGAADTIASLFGSPILASVEIIQAFLAPSVFLSLGYAALQGQHIKVDLFTGRLPKGPSHVLLFASLALGGAVFCFIAWMSWQQGMHAMTIREVSAGYVPIPIWISKLLVALGATIAAIECVRQLAWLAIGVDPVERDSVAPDDTAAGF